MFATEDGKILRSSPSSNFDPQCHEGALTDDHTAAEAAVVLETYDWSLISSFIQICQIDRSLKDLDLCLDLREGNATCGSRTMSLSIVQYMHVCT